MDTLGVSLTAGGEMDTLGVSLLEREGASITLTTSSSLRGSPPPLRGGGGGRGGGVPLFQCTRTCLCTVCVNII